MPKYRNILKENLENFDKVIMSYEDFHEIFKGFGQACSNKDQNSEGQTTDHS